MPSYRTFSVHPHSQLHISCRWALATAGVGSWYEAEGLDLIAPETISVDHDGSVYFDSARIHQYAEKHGSWDLLAAIDQDEYLAGDIPYFICAAMFSKMDSFALDLDTSSIVIMRTGAIRLQRVDGIRFDAAAETIELRSEGTQDWFPIDHLTNDLDGLRSLIVNVAFSMHRGLWSLTETEVA